MQLVLILLGLILISSSKCMKRRIDDELKERKSKRVRSETIMDRQAVPKEVLSIILIQVIADFAGFLEDDPVRKLKLVCQDWHSLIRSPQFQVPLKKLPNICCWIVQKHLAEKKAVPLIPLQISLHLLSEANRFSLLFNAHRVEILEEIVKLPNWSKCQADWRKQAYMTVVSEGIMLAVPFFDSLQNYWAPEAFIQEMNNIFLSFQSEPFCCHGLFAVPQQELAKLLLIDDLTQLGEGSFFHTYICDEVVHLYHFRKSDCEAVTLWLSGFKGITMPFARKNLLMNLFYFTMAVAVLAEDRKFVYYIMGNDYKLPENAFEAALHLLCLGNPENKPDSSDPMRQLDEILYDEIMTRENIEWMGFDKQIIKSTIESLAFRIGPDAKVRAIVAAEF
jgi:hypothetical protein